MTGSPGRYQQKGACGDSGRWGGWELSTWHSGWNCAATHASGDGGGSTSQRQMSKAGSETKLPGDSLQDRARLEFHNTGAQKPGSQGSHRGAQPT